MPKKHKKFQYIKPVIPVHPSLSSSPAPHHGATSDSSTPATSVNDLIQHLRRSQAPSSLDRSYDDSNPHPTVHPSLKAILQLPDTPAPLPRMTNSRSRRERGPAGPPPPQSWLLDSVHAPRSSRGWDAASSSEPIGFARLDRLPGTHIPDDRTLMHQAFKTLASNWTWHMDYDQYYLPALPDRQKEALLAYIAVYNPQSLTRAALDLLFLGPSALKGATGSDTVTHLDLSGASIRDFASIFTPPAPAATTLLPGHSDSIPESWDAPPSSLPPSISTTRFPSLTHLSLAHSPHPSWRALLAALPHLAPLTHLSLAHWPPPTLTPNALTATTAPTSLNPSSRPRVPYSASDYYTAAFGDWKEAAALLRRLARGTLCLKWLDLDGCTRWLDALVWHPDPDAHAPPRGDDDGGVPWCTAWRGVETVRVAQGWLPPCVDPASSHRDDGVMRKERVRGMLASGTRAMRRGEGADLAGGTWDADVERRMYREKGELRRWLEGEVRARRVERRVQRLRWGRGLKGVVFEKTGVVGWVEDVIGERGDGGV